MIHERWIGSFAAVALGGAFLMVASPGCEESAEEQPRDEAANDEPTDERPPAPDEDGDDENREELEWSRRAPPSPANDRPRCLGDGWHDSGVCLTKCSGDAAYAVASERRTIDYKWCFARAGQYCGERGVKLHDACWGVAGDRRDESEE